MVGIVIVSHSAKLAEGLRELAIEMATDKDLIVPAGGMEDGSIGTDAMRIKAAIEKADRGDGVVVLLDLGSSVMSTQMAIEFLEEEESGIRVEIADAPMVEACISAAVVASAGQSFEDVMKIAEDAIKHKKL